MEDRSCLTNLISTKVIHFVVQETRSTIPQHSLAQTGFIKTNKKFYEYIYKGFRTSWQEEHHNWGHLQGLHRKQGFELVFASSARRGGSTAHFLVAAPHGHRGVSPADPPQCPALVEKAHSEWCQGQEQQKVSHVLAGIQVFVGTASSHGWMQP